MGDGTGNQPSPDNFVTYDMVDKDLQVTSTNTSTNLNANANTLGPFVSGRVSYNGTVYVSTWGHHGILIAVGGPQDTSQGQRANRTKNNNAQNFQTVHVYDIGNARWYEQQSSGDIPDTRQDFCMAGSPSSNRTHEILVYAGWNGQPGPGAIPYDSAYVLTLPGFFWVKANYTAAHPRHGLTCEAVGGSQILTIGGVDSTQQKDPNTNDTYTPGFNTRDPFPQGLAIFDLASLAWSSSYSANRGFQPPASQIQAYYNTK